jgi:hypothetical protein
MPEFQVIPDYVIFDRVREELKSGTMPEDLKAELTALVTPTFQRTFSLYFLAIGFVFLIPSITLFVSGQIPVAIASLGPPMAGLYAGYAFFKRKKWNS